MSTSPDGGLFDRAPDDQVQLLTPDGTLKDGYEPALSDERLRGMYRDMRLARRFDERMISLQRQGRVGTYASLAGQEGSQVGSTYALASDDWVVYQYREHAAVLARGFPSAYVRYWAGHESGNAALADLNIAPLNVSIAAHIPHAVGMAWAAKLQGDDRAFVCHFGDGATSEGDFHEACNFAGVFDVPVVLFCNNNQWAISVPRERQTASETIAQKAAAYGFEGIQVDGMGPLACYEVTRAAVTRARARTRDAGDDVNDVPRPTLIEAVQYRYGAHTTADDPTAYRDEATVERWRERDPIDRFEAFLRRTDRLDDEAADAIETEVEETVASAIEAAEDATADSPDPADSAGATVTTDTANTADAADPDDLFADAYAEPTPRVEAQRASLRDLRERHGDDALTHEE